MELVEKQDAMMECLQEKLDISNEEIRLFREADQKKRSSENESLAIVAAAEQKIAAAAAAVELLQTRNEKLEAELEELKRKADEAKPVASVIQLRNRVKELEFDLTREQRNVSNLQNDVDYHKGRVEQLQSELDACNAKNISVTSSLAMKLEDNVKKLADLKIRYQSIVNERDSITSEMEGELEVLMQRSAHLQAHCERLSSEMMKLRKECKVAECRIAALVEENAMSEERTGHKEYVFRMKMEENRLLKDQSHLIAALREEGKLLLEQLESERKEYRCGVV
ncbi:hypothetical protein COOONC_02975 [Cooperia oncophora]